MKAESNLKGLPVRIADDLCKYWSSEQVREEEHHDDETEVTVVLGLPAFTACWPRAKVSRIS